MTSSKSRVIVKLKKNLYFLGKVLGIDWLKKENGREEIVNTVNGIKK